jgi:hypothetical protein
MSVLDVMKEEHALLLRFCAKLRWEEPSGAESPRRVRGDLLALFCALERHEEFENAVFAATGEGKAGPARAPESLLEEHDRLARLRVETVAAVKSADEEPPLGLKSRVDALAAHLRDHFRWEEDALWSRRAPRGDDESEAALENAARARLEGLRAEIQALGIGLT